MLVSSGYLSQYEDICNEKKPLTSNQQLGNNCLSWIPKRYIVLLMVFLGYFHAYTMCVLINVSVVSMTSNRTVLVNQTIQEKGPEFTWTKSEIGMLLSSFFNGYLITHIPGGILAERVGGKCVFGGGVLGSAISIFLMPSCAYISIYLLMCVSLLNGLFQGVVLPSIYIIWAKWAPEQEKTKLFNFSYSGSFVGTVVALSFSGILAESTGCWSSSFYLFGSLTVMWFPLWCYIISESPEKHSTITKTELSFIQENRVYSESQSQDNVLPWADIASSSAVWGTTTAFCANSWVYFTMITEMPSFVKFALDFDLKQTGLVLSLIYIVSFLIATVCSPVADFLIHQCHIKTVWVRKCFGCGGLVNVAILSIVTCHLADSTTAVVFLTIVVGFAAIAIVGINVNYLDIAPQYSSVLMGIANTLAAITGIVVPSLTSQIVQNKYSREDWQSVFYITAGIAVFGAVIFGLFASGSIESWADSYVVKNNNQKRTLRQSSESNKEAEAS